DVHSGARVAVPRVTEVWALQLVGQTLYLGGRFDEIGGMPRTDLAALDVRTRQVLPFDARISCTCDDVVVGPVPEQIGAFPPSPPSFGRVSWAALSPPDYV